MFNFNGGDMERVARESILEDTKELLKKHGLSSVQVKLTKKGTIYTPVFVGSDEDVKKAIEVFERKWKS